MKFQASPLAVHIRAAWPVKIGGIPAPQGGNPAVQAVLLNCSSGRDYPFELLNLTEFSRMDFYRRRAGFLCCLAANLHLD